MSIPTTAPARVAIVTGASAGIGAACATVLAERGYNLVVMSRSDAIHAAAQKFNGIAVQGSVAIAADLSRLVETALHKFGRIDAVVNGSGHPESGDLLSISDDAWTEVFAMYF